MKKISIIIFFLIPVFAFSQTRKQVITKKAYTYPFSYTPAPIQRILFDFGGDGNVDANETTDTGVQTPNNSITNGAPGQAGDGRWWNNIVNCTSGTLKSTTIVDTANTTITGMSIATDVNACGSFVSPQDRSINTGGTVQAVGDYPSTAVRDNWYWYNSLDSGHITIVIPAGKTATVTFWGNRGTTGPRILQFKKQLQTFASAIEYDAANNTTFSTKATFTGITGTQVFTVRVKSGSTFGHISVIDITMQ